MFELLAKLLKKAFGLCILKKCNGYAFDCLQDKKMNLESIKALLKTFNEHIFKNKALFPDEHFSDLAALTIAFNPRGASKWLTTLSACISDPSHFDEQASLGLYSNFQP